MKKYRSRKYPLVPGMERYIEIWKQDKRYEVILGIDHQSFYINSWHEAQTLSHAGWLARQLSIALKRLLEKPRELPTRNGKGKAKATAEQASVGDDRHGHDRGLPVASYRRRRKPTSGPTAPR